MSVLKTDLHYYSEEIMTSFTTMKYIVRLKKAIQVRNIPDIRDISFSPGITTAVILWILCLINLPIDSFDEEFMITVFGIIIPYGIFLYRYSIKTVIPKSYEKKRPFWSYIGKIFLILILSTIPVLLLSLLLTGGDGELVVGLLNVPVHLFATVPFAWWIYKHRMKGTEITHLKKELGQTSANFDFLRSQINPHFLFNALNTIYGTAIQEKAERTSEGIEKLGDMMRFMLQENMQERIPLSREVEYLRNYISLQRLRTESSDTVKIQTEIQEQTENIQIAPMLLIPFVENAFKHGISFREPSPLNITLEVKDNILHFDVYNNKHSKKENDPEKDKSGIGLVNVRQRLQLQYPDKHDLFIRETSREFFIHLTVTLKS